MREILFRGKSRDNDKWVYGSLIAAGTYCCILEEEGCVHPADYPYLDDDIGTIDGMATPVIPETVGQFTGLSDKNGKKIFEGDIMRNAGNVVELCNGSFCINGDSSLAYWTTTEIIGNIHDNMKFDYFIHACKPIAMVITVKDYKRIKHLLQKFYSEKELTHIDEFCDGKPSHELFLLSNPYEKSRIITPMMFLNAITFVDRILFENVMFREGDLI